MTSMNGDKFFGGAMLGVLSLVSFFCSSTAGQFVATSIVSASCMMASHVAFRIYLFLWERRRYSGDVEFVLKRAFCFNFASGIFYTVIIFINSLFFRGVLQNCELIPLGLSTPTSFLISVLMKWHHCPAWDAYMMNQMNGLDYGSGIAHSYFHGYLRLILPTKGDQRNGFRERIEEYIEKQGIPDCNFPVKKLIILLPSSGFIYPKLSDDPSRNNKDIEPVPELTDHFQDRAGTRQRVYRGGAYRITIRSGKESSFVYTVAEGATPLLTFREAYSAGTEEAAHLRQHKVDIVENFYKTLKKLVEDDKECRHLVELLYYNDEDHKNPHDAVGLLRDLLLARRESQ